MWFRKARWWARLIGLSGASRMRLRVGYGEDSEVSGRSRDRASPYPRVQYGHGSPLSPAKVSVDVWRMSLKKKTAERDGRPATRRPDEKKTILSEWQALCGLPQPGRRVDGGHRGTQMVGGDRPSAR